MACHSATSAMSRSSARYDERLHDLYQHRMLRVIDEDRSEPDGYLYPVAMFAPIELPEAAQRVLLAAGD